MSKKPITIAIWICALAILVLAAAPTLPPTLSPTDGAVIFGDIELTCSGSTDGDGDTIYYAFYDNLQVADKDEFTVSTTTGVGGPTDSDYGLNYAYIQATVGESGNITAYDLYFYDDNMTMEIYKDEVNGGGQIRILLDNTTELYKSSAGSGDFRENITIGNGALIKNNSIHNISFEVDNAPGADKVNFYINWTKSKKGVTVLKQNLTTTTYEYENTTDNILESFWWSCQACDTNGECSAATTNRTIDVGKAFACNDTNQYVAVNLTVWDEENQSRIVSNLDFDLDFENGYSSTSFNYAANETTNKSICISPIGTKVNISGLISYEANDTVQYPFGRQYIFDDAEVTSGTVQETGLYLLTGGLSTSVTFNVLRNAVGVEDIILHLQRYDVGTGTFTLVAMAETDGNGQTVIPLRTTDAYYKVLAYEGGTLVYDSGSIIFLSSSYTIQLSGGEGDQTGYEDYYQLGSITWNLDWNGTGVNRVVLTADDASGASTQMCLKVERYLQDNGTELLMYNCTTSASATMHYEITDLDAYHLAKFIVYTDGAYRVLEQLEIRLSQNLSDILGSNGLFYAFIIVLTMALLGASSMAAMLILTMAGLGFSVIIGFISLGWAAIAGIFVGGLIILLNLKR